MENCKEMWKNNLHSLPPFFANFRSENVPQKKMLKDLSLHTFRYVSSHFKEHIPEKKLRVSAIARLAKIWGVCSWTINLL